MIERHDRAALAARYLSFPLEQRKMNRLFSPDNRPFRLKSSFLIPVYVQTKSDLPGMETRR
jgi:hypothetical protein